MLTSFRKDIADLYSSNQMREFSEMRLNILDRYLADNHIDLGVSNTYSLDTCDYVHKKRKPKATDSVYDDDESFEKRKTRGRPRTRKRKDVLDDRNDIFQESEESLKKNSSKVMDTLSKKGGLTYRDFAKIEQNVKEEELCQSFEE